MYSNLEIIIFLFHNERMHILVVTRICLKVNVKWLKIRQGFDNKGRKRSIYLVLFKYVLVLLRKRASRSSFHFMGRRIE